MKKLIDILIKNFCIPINNQEQFESLNPNSKILALSNSQGGYYMFKKKYCFLNRGKIKINVNDLIGAVYIGENIIKRITKEVKRFNRGYWEFNLNQVYNINGKNP